LEEEEEESHIGKEMVLVPLAPRRGVATTPLQEDPILQARETAGDLLVPAVVSPSPPPTIKDSENQHPNKAWKRVRFCEQATTVCNLPNNGADDSTSPLENTTDMFWSQAESNACLLERKELLRTFQQHIHFSPLVPWTEDAESIRGLEDQFADMVGRTHSYFIRKRHGDLILREYRRTKYSGGPNGDDAMERLSLIAAYSSEEDKERALEMAQLDACMAKEAGEEGATTSPLGSEVFSSGEALIHSLLVGIRDYGSS
jgi:hypothetical protein